MAKTGNKTTENKNSVTDFIKSVPDEQRKKDAFALIEIIKKQSGFDAKMWGSAIIGFGSYHYKYESGREGDAPLIAFSPRKNSLTLYLPDFESKEQLLQKLGKHKQSGGCTHIIKLTDVDNTVLKQLLDESFKHAETTHCK